MHTSPHENDGSATEPKVPLLTPLASPLVILPSILPPLALKSISPLLLPCSPPPSTPDAPLSHTSSPTNLESPCGNKKRRRVLESPLPYSPPSPSTPDASHSCNSPTTNLESPGGKKKRRRLSESPSVSPLPYSPPSPSTPDASHSCNSPTTNLESPGRNKKQRRRLSESPPKINGVGRPKRRKCFPSSHIMPVRCFTCGRVLANRRILGAFERYLTEGLSECDALNRVHGGKLVFCCRSMLKQHQDMTVMRFATGKVCM